MIDDKDPTSQLVLSLASFSNEELRLIFGQYDNHLKLIKQALELELRTIGNNLILEGKAANLSRARRIFEEIFNLVQKDAQTFHSDFIKIMLKNTHITDSESISSNAADIKRKITKASIQTQKKLIHSCTETQAIYIQALKAYDLVFGLGPAGTGKTYLAVAYAASLLENGFVERIILSRPAVEAGERLGFLPGDLKEKVDPYLRPLYDALYDMLGSEKVNRLLEQQRIEIAPLAYMRGRNLLRSMIILDEAQNTTPMQMKMFLTRLGEGSHMVVTGDISQTDLPSGQVSGLAEAIRILKNVKMIKFVQFCQKDIIRHPLVQEIIDAYNQNTTLNY